MREVLERIKRDFRILTANSANPFDWGLYGELVLWRMSCCCQNSRNPDLNWGPLSDMIDNGNPNSRKIDIRQLHTACVEREDNLNPHKNPEKRSTTANQVFPPKSNRSQAKSSIGKCAREIIKDSFGFDWRSVWQEVQFSIFCLIELLIPGQKYS